MSRPVEDTPRSGAPGYQTAFERWLERLFILFAKAMTAMAFVVVVYGVLVGSFFVCCGVDSLALANPTKSPLGPAATILIVWPLGGLLCLLLDGGLGDLLEAVEKGTKRLIRAVRG